MASSRPRPGMLLNYPAMYKIVSTPIQTTSSSEFGKPWLKPIRIPRVWVERLLFLKHMAREEPECLYESRVL